MAKPSGFLEFTRVLPGKRPVRERINDYNEFVKRYDDETLTSQASRCMNCGVPFCHNGCPLGNNIPDFNDAVYRKNWEEAYHILSTTNNFPEFTGRICPAPCESSCVLGINQPAITIEEIEKHIIEIAFENGLVKPHHPIYRTGKKVAVIGSGPAGLAAAAQLNYAGHSVTVFERDDQPGGLLRYGIPDFKLEKWVVERRIKLLQEEGITIICNAEVGTSVQINNILREFQAVILATGSTVPRDLQVPGRHLKGIHFAMDFLKQQNKRVMKQDIDGEEILATSQNVIIIGGGDTGSDCVGTAVRQGASSITQFELLPKPPSARNENMPWPVFPMILKTTSSHEEGGSRQWSVATKEFLGDENGRLRALKVVDIEWKYSNDGRPVEFVMVPGTERELPCTLVLLSMGFLHTRHTGLLDELSIERDQRGNIHASEKTYCTSIPKVFTAGDARRGQSLVVWAISEGRECARSVDAFLMGGNSWLETRDASLPASALSA